MILVTGADGYLGWPVLLELSQHFKDERIIGLDNFARRNWVAEVGSVSAIPITTPDTRIQTAKKHGFTNVSLLEADLSNQETVYKILKLFKPRAIVHLAAQPSAPYSHINGERANFTQENNNRMCRNLLWGLHELGFHECHFIETTTTGVYGAPDMDIPEGFIELNGWNQAKVTIPYPGMATSWYHMSKSNDVNSLYVANHMWELPVSDIRTSIVFGTSTEHTNIHPNLATRYDFDFYFGVVPNRFVAQALAGHPITVYGAGDQKKPMITLPDAVTSIRKAVEMSPAKSLSVYNQFSLLVSPNDLATTIQKVASDFGIKVLINHLPNPRVEKETHSMIMYNKRFSTQLLQEEPVGLEKAIREMFQALLPYRSTLLQHKDLFI